MTGVTQNLFGKMSKSNKSVNLISQKNTQA